MTPYIWTRATAAIAHECNFCLTDTNRIITFKKPEQPSPIVAFICDDCLSGIKGIEERKPASA